MKTVQSTASSTRHAFSASAYLIGMVLLAKHISEIVIQSACLAVMAQVLLIVTCAFQMLQKHLTAHALATKDGRFLTVHYGKENALMEICARLAPKERTHVTHV